MRMQFGLSAYERARGGLPDLPVENMYLEKTPSEETGLSLQSRPGLSETSTLGSNVQAIFQKDGVFAGSYFQVADTALYRDGAYIGAIDGDGPFSIDGYSDMVFVCGGGSLWSYDGASLEVVQIEGETYQFSRLVVGASRLVAVQADTEQYWFSGALDDVIEGLNFATAESQPDRLRDILFIDDMLILFGADTVEFHINTTDADAPFAPLEGRVFESGIREAGACTGIGSTFAWVTNDHRVCIGDPESVVTNEGLEAQIKASTIARLWTFYIDATEFLALRLDTATYVMPLRTRSWHNFTSYGETNWLPQCHAGGVFGTSDGRLATFSGHLDFGSVLVRLFRGGFPINSGGVTVNNIIMRTNPGATTYLEGDYAEPVVEMRISRDKGYTWGEYRPVSMGTQGAYRKKISWRGLGMASQPGLLAEFRLTAPTDWRVSDLLVNENMGGR